MDPSLLLNYVDSRLILATFLGALIGLERELAGKDPSFRTFALISLGSCIFSIISNSLAFPPPVKGTPYPITYVSDPGRIAAQIVVGIGFLGAGTIFRSRQKVLGLTTAALMWVTAAIGMAIGFEKYELGIAGTLTAILLLYILSGLHYLIHYLRTRGEAPPTEGE